MATTIRKSEINAAASLLKRLVDKADVNKDGSLTPRDLNTAAGKPKTAKRYEHMDVSTFEALKLTVGGGKSAGKQDNVGLKEIIDDAKVRALALDRDGNGVLSAAEGSRRTTNLAKALMEFARNHAGDKVADFKFGKLEEPGFRPARPFTPRGNAEQVANAVVKHFDNWNNNNRWPGGFTSRVVMGPDESKLVLAEIEKLSPARAKAVLTRISESIHSGAPGLMYVTPEALRQWDRVAARLGVPDLDFKGARTAPGFPGY
ncbi:MAG: hypothetical protein IPI55_17190 [Flavobacteriales bacterium]|nr:hypothetical protein [Flavobacteriales bacterium]